MDPSEDEISMELYSKYLLSVKENYASDVSKKTRLQQVKKEITARTVKMALMLINAKNYLTVPLTNKIQGYRPNVVYLTKPSGIEELSEAVVQLRTLKKYVDKDTDSLVRGVVFVTLTDYGLKIPINFNFWERHDCSSLICSMYNDGTGLKIPHEKIDRIEVALFTNPRTFEKEIQLEARFERNLTGSTTQKFDASLL
jgi:hypothetical protein